MITIKRKFVTRGVCIICFILIHIQVLILHINDCNWSIIISVVSNCIFIFYTFNIKNRIRIIPKFPLTPSIENRTFSKQETQLRANAWFNRIPPLWTYPVNLCSTLSSKIVSKWTWKVNDNVPSARHKFKIVFNFSSLISNKNLLLLLQ